MTERKFKSGVDFLNDESTVELVHKARAGDHAAVEALVRRCFPPLKQWAHGRLPKTARGYIDTGDLVQEAVLHVLQHLGTFEPRRVGAMQAYLRQSVINRIRDEVRRVSRWPVPVDLPETLQSKSMSPLESAVENEAYDRYRGALERLKPNERGLVVARIELQWRMDEIANGFELPSVDAARMAVNRALRRLRAHMSQP